MISRLFFKNYVACFFASLMVLLAMMQISITDYILKILYIFNAELTVLFLFSHPRRPYSLQKMVNFFILFFFIIANAIQYSTNTITSSITIELLYDDYVRFQILVFIIVVLFNFSYGMYDTSNKCVAAKHDVDYSSQRVILLSVLSLIIMLWSARNNILTFFVRGIVEELSNSSGGGEESQGYVSYLIMQKVVRAIPFSCAIIAMNSGFRKKDRLILLLLMLIALFPPGLPRNAIAMYWLPVLLISSKRLNKGNVFIFLMLFGLLVVFPFFDIFRRWNGSFEYEYSLDFLNDMNFDSSQEFMIAIKKNVITWGYQLLGAVLFFVPRAIWPSKPIGSGALMAEDDGVFSNISMPFFGEGYVNFGFVGVVIFTIVLASICSKLDKKYWYNKDVFNRYKPYYLLLVGAILFIMRGDLMSSLAYTLGTIASVYLTERLCIIKKEQK